MSIKKKSLRIIPLGGLGEIGLNMMVIEYGDSAIIIDAGLMFPEDYMLGVDIVIPVMDYVRKNSDTILGIFLTHAHEDHIGALPYLLKDVNIPVYGTPFTIGIIKRKIEEFNIPGSSVVYHEVNPKNKVKLGEFELDFIRVNHSTIDGVGIAINTPVGIIIHTGDFKISYSIASEYKTDINKFAQYGNKNVLALMSDSTNVEKEGYTVDASKIGDTLRNIISNSSGRVIVALFASNIGRIKQVIKIAENLNRKIVFNGRSVETSVSIAKELGRINFNPDNEIDIKDANNYPDENLIIITTGSQGEPMSSLARMATGVHKQIKIKTDDIVILSSKFIPGNEKAITNIINTIYKRGADVIYEKISDIHVSGHAFQEELKMMINLTKPTFFIPIHGEYRHLFHHAKLAESVGLSKENIILAENGNVIEYNGNNFEINESVTTGRVLVDGKGIGDVGRSVLKERRMLSEDGLVIVTIVFDEETGIVIHGPEIISRGFVFWTQTGHLVDDAQCVILEIIEDVHAETKNRTEIIRSKIQKALTQYFNYTIRRRPVIVPIILEL
ncbi:MAG: ribonuclease J [Desulfobacterales bacterium]|nr:ribonuclease J [Desulfobacterales bacterium]MCP4160170.1 ribonuclease J [Deltaproteobacteria bacterium]